MSQSPTGFHSDIHRSTVEKSAEIAGRSRLSEVRVGGIYTLKATAEWPIEWALVDSDDEGRLLGIPADTHSAVGKADLAVQESPLGPLTLRCGSGLWLHSDLFAESSSGSELPEDAVRAAKVRFEGAREARLAGSPLAERTEERLDYREWLSETVGPAVQAARAATNAVQKEPDNLVIGDFSGAPDPVDPVQVAPDSGSPWSLKRAMAASLWVGLIGLTALAGWQFNEIETLKADRDSMIGSYGSEELSNSALEVNVDLHWLLPSVVERGEATIPFSRESRTSVWVLQIQDTTPYPSYRVRIVNDEGEGVWNATGLQRNETMEVNLAIPTRSLAPGRYTFELYAESSVETGESGSDHLLDRYLVSIDERAEGADDRTGRSLQAPASPSF